MNTDFIYSKPYFQKHPILQSFEPSDREYFSITVSKNLSGWLREKSIELGFSGPSEMTSELLNRFWRSEKAKQ